MGNKTTVGTTALGGALAAIIVWIIVANGIDVPGQIGAAIAVVCGSVLGFLKEAID